MSASLSNGAAEANLAAAYLRERHEVRYQARIEIEVSGIDPKHDLFREVTFGQVRGDAVELPGFYQHIRVRFLQADGSVRGASLRRQSAQCDPEGS